MGQQQPTHPAADEARGAASVWPAWEPIPGTTIEATVRQIIDQFQPQQVILFGSYAYSHPHPGSDLDLLVVLDTAHRERAQAVAICQAIDYHFPLDLIVRTPATLARRLALGDAFLSDVVHKGKLLYERPDA